MKVCNVEGCGNPTFGRGWCGAHYMRWRRYGDPTGIPVTVPRPVMSEADVLAWRERVNRRARFWTAAILVGMLNDAVGA